MIAGLDTAARLAMFCWTIGISLAELLQMSRLEQLDFVRAAGGDHGLVRMIIETPVPVKLQKVEQGLAASFGRLALPKNNMDILGVYSLSATELAIVPDIGGISRSLKLRGDHIR